MNLKLENGINIYYEIHAVFVRKLENKTNNGSYKWQRKIKKIKTIPNKTLLFKKSLPNE